MLDSTAIRLLATPGQGLYESFYFRGTSSDSQQAFWLKHNMLRMQGSPDVRLGAALILFDRVANRTHAVYSSEVMDKDRFARLSQIARNWDHVAIELRNGARVEITRAHLAGDLFGEGGHARWELQLRPSGVKLRQFPFPALYDLPWPRHKVLTRDCMLGFHGSVSAGGMTFSGDFLGMNGHNWGSGHSHTYAYANCAQFAGHPHAYFDGFSAKVALAGGRLVTPHLSIASLLLHGQWHRFDSLLRAPRQKVQRLDDYGWQAQLRNRTHRLEIDIDGGAPDSVPWAALNYDNPDGHRSVVKNTKFATIQLRLCALTGEVEDELASEACELETLLPDNRPASDGYIGTA